MSQTSRHLHLDLAIIGGGVAGLWLANRARQQGFRLAVFESKALGSDQTLASQGMIHGGMKYTLGGSLTGASEAIAEMPRHWRDCLCGEGDVNLRHTRILSDHFFMWSTESIASRLTTFLASKITRGRVEPVSDDRRPPLLRNGAFSGSLYKLEDLVIDTPSLVANLARNIDGDCFQIDWSRAALKRSETGEVTIEIQTETELLVIHAQRIILTAGKGNRELLSQLGLSTPAMQLRPLRQVMIKHNFAFDFFGHCLGAETTPRLTISSHRLPHGEHIWYLGGSLAEKGAHMEPDAVIDLARRELAELIPWIDMSHAEFSTLYVERAEPLQPGLRRPDNAFVAATEAPGLLVGWPTKLTLAPNLASETLRLLKQQEIKPSPGVAQPLKGLLPAAAIAATPWDLAFPPALSAEERMARQFPADDEE